MSGILIALGMSIVWLVIGLAIWLPMRAHRRAVARQQAEKAEYERALAAGEVPPDEVPKFWPHIDFRV